MQSNKSPLQALADTWRADLQQLRHYHFDERAAALTARCLQQLESALAQEADEVLTLTEAAAISGYSAEHLARLVREGSIPNAGRLNAPRVRRRHLPLKRGHLRGDTSPMQVAARRTEIARSIVTSN